MPLFVVGPPRSGTTIVTQTLNTHPKIKIFDEVSLIDALDHGEAIVGKVRAFLMQRGGYEAFRTRVLETGDPASALSEVMASIVGPGNIWGEKNPMYATQLDVLRQSFPDALLLFLLRDPRHVVNSYLAHRNSPSRSHLDFWIKDTVSEALTLLETCLEPLTEARADLVVLRYEHFMADPKATLDGVLSRWNIHLQEETLFSPHLAPDSVGDHQFFRRGALLPWKESNLSALRPSIDPQDRLDPSDPAWAKVNELAASLGYA